MAYYYVKLGGTAAAATEAYGYGGYGGRYDISYGGGYGRGYGGGYGRGYGGGYGPGAVSQTETASELVRGLATLITQTVRPESWQSPAVVVVGGAATRIMTYLPGIDKNASGIVNNRDQIALPFPIYMRPGDHVKSTVVNLNAGDQISEAFVYQYVFPIT